MLLDWISILLAIRCCYSQESNFSSSPSVVISRPPPVVSHSPPVVSPPPPVVITVGHLMPANPAIQHEPQVLKLCAEDLRKRKILPPNTRFEVITLPSCDKFSGIEHAVYLHYLNDTTVYFGPGCNEEILIIGRLAPRWNVPIIAHMSGDDKLTNREIFPTLGSVALTSAHEMAQATLALLQFYNWQKIAIVRPTQNFDRLSIHSLIQMVKMDKKMSITVNIEFDRYASAEQIIASDELKKLQDNARVIVVEMGMDLDDVANFLVAIEKSGMKNDQYVYIVPWLSHTSNYYPWESPSLDRQLLRNAYESVIVITAHGYDEHFLKQFQKKFYSEVGLSSNRYAAVVYMSLYDALYLYGLAYRDAYNETGNHNIHKNGSFICQKMANREFIGLTGQVLMNDQAVRVPSYATYQITNTTLRLVAELTAFQEQGSKCASRKNCIIHVPREILSNFWRTADGQAPNDVPYCGFDGSLCDHTKIYVIASVGVISVISLAIGCLLYRKEKERRLYDMTWRIPRDSVRLMNQQASRSSHTFNKTVTSSMSTVDSAVHSQGDMLVGMCMGVKLIIKRYEQMRNITFPKKDLLLLKDLKLLENENLNKFYGMCFNQQNEMLILWVFVSRGSLEDILFNDEMKFGHNFQVSFTKDVVNGLLFLHTTPIQYHGMLCIENCVVDSSWTIKLTNFGIQTIIADKLIHNEIKVVRKQGHDGGNNDARLNRKYLQQAPEILRSVLTTKYISHGSQAADVYSLGMVIYQILFRREPFQDSGISDKILLEKLVNGTEDNCVRPTFPSNTNDDSYSLKLLNAIEACWLETPEMRPNIKKIKNIVTSNLKTKGGGSLIDQMMKMMEEYTLNLETMVKDRTAMLEEAQQQADRLLYNMLPKSVADDLKIGKAVPPQLYSSATVLFSDIRGFTNLSSTSTPFQIVQFLNDLFTGFDDIIAKHDAYKVETIGDAYMIVSGVPTENGNSHAEQIAEVALKMREFVSKFKLAHRPNEQLMVRIGFHSGSVAAGVVGLAAPRYCLFGDTVNTASRMESTGEPNKIQISEQSYSLLHCYYPDFRIIERGRIPIKGKGECTTYFLEEKVGDDRRMA